MFKMGKLGILWELDRKTGKFVAGHDLGYQTLFDLDPQTGRLTIGQVVLQKQEIPSRSRFLPGDAGVQELAGDGLPPRDAGVLRPDAVVLPKGTFTRDGTKGGWRRQRGDVRLERLHPSEGPGKTGQFLAMDIRRARSVAARDPFTMASAALTTAGGLAIVGDSDRYLYIHDAASGKIVFQTRLPTAVQGFPITYTVKGQQDPGRAGRDR